MSSPDRDRYEAYYAEKIWGLLPEVYRAEDSAGADRAGPLREMVNRIGAQAAVVRRSIDRTWEDQSIETCDDWVIAYLGDLLATNLVAALDARGQRVDVAKTIHYRRRKGTLGVLEELAFDVTGWNARVVEMFRRLGRTRHLLDPAIGWPEDTTDPEGARALQFIQGLVGRDTRTNIGGYADLRNVTGAARRGAFDELYHTADVRRGHGSTGLHNIMKIGVFLWRKKSLGIEHMTPVRSADCPNQLTFDPTGRDVPLFAAAPPAFDVDAAPLAEHEIRGPISRRLLASKLAALYGATLQNAAATTVPRSLSVFRLAGSFHDLIPVAEVTTDPDLLSDPGFAFTAYLDPERGRVYLRPVDVTADLRVSCHFGFSSTIGAHGYDRRRGAPAFDPPIPVTTASGGGNALHDALVDLYGSPGTSGTIVLGDSLTYDAIQNGTLTDVAIRASREGQNTRPTVRSKDVWEITGTGGTLVIDGVLLSGGGELVLKGSFKRVLIYASTLDPGTWAGSDYAAAIDGRKLEPFRLRVQGSVELLDVQRSIVGPILTEAAAGEPRGAIEVLSAVDSVIQGISSRALDLQSGEVRLSRVTVLGDRKGSVVHRLFATDSVLHGDLDVIDDQHGCVRFSAWTTGSELPRKFESVEVPEGAAMFASRAFGNPSYAALVESAPAGVLSGAEDGSEMGAFCREKNPIKEKSLLIKYREYMPIGLTPVLVHVT